MPTQRQLRGVRAGWTAPPGDPPPPRLVLLPPTAKRPVEKNWDIRRKSSQIAPAFIRTYLSDVERGSRNICLFNIERLAGALELRISDLFQRAEAQ